MSVRKSVSWSAAKQVLTFAVGFAGSIALARLLTPRQFGVYAVALATQGVLFSFAAFSVGAYIIRAEEVSRDLLRRAFTVHATLLVCLFIGLQIAALLSDAGTLEADIGTVLRILSLVPLIGVLEFVPSALLSREMNFRVMAIAGMLRSIVMTLLAVGLAAAGFGAPSLAIGQVAGAVASAVALNVAKRRDVVLLPTFSGLRPILHFGLQILSVSGVAQLASRASDLLLGQLQGLASLGLYARASSISSMIFENVYGLVTGVLFAKMSIDLREKGNIHGIYLRSVGLITGALWPALIGMAVLARPLVKILYGERWLAAAMPLSILMLAQFVALGIAMNMELFVLRGETARQARYEVYRAVFGVAVFAAGAYFSIGAAALGRLAEVVLGYALYRPHIERLAGLARGDLRRTYADSLLLTAVAVAPATALMLATGWDPSVSPLVLASTIALGGALWFAVLAMRDHVILQELRILKQYVKG